MKLNLIVAHNMKMVIGKDNKLPWYLPEDLARFKELTLGKAVIMGRKTYESIGKALPGRRNIVVTSRADISEGDRNIVAVSSLDEAISHAHKLCCPEAFLIGGERIYKEAIDRDLVDMMYVTLVHNGNTDGDAFFPEIDYTKWMRSSSPIREYNGTYYSFWKVERLNGN